MAFQHVPKEDATNSVEYQIRTVCQEIADMLSQKNKLYGNSALEPLRIFSKADVSEGINIRIDDKLSRIANVKEEDETEDTLLDLIGYLILKKIQQKYGQPNKWYKINTS